MRRVRRALQTAAVVAAGAGVAYYAYQWWCVGRKRAGSAEKRGKGGDERCAVAGPTRASRFPHRFAEPSEAYYASLAAAAADDEQAAAAPIPGAEEVEGDQPPALPTRAAEAPPSSTAPEVELARARRRPEPAANGAATASPPPPPPPPLDPLAAKAASDLEKHYASVQSVADAVTLPTTLTAVAAAARADADLEAMATALRTGSLTGDAKIQAWSALRVAALERLVAAPWLVAAAAVTTRAGVNVLGRRLFVAAQLGGGGARPRVAAVAGAPPSPPATVPKPSQERFLEFAQAVATRSAAGVRDIVAAAVRGATDAHPDLTNLAAPVAVPYLLDALSDAYAAVERGIAAAGWRAVLLPPVADADRFFADAAAEDDETAAADAAVVDATARAMAGELAAVVESDTFGDAARAAAAAAATETAAAVTEALGGGSGAPPLPLARIIPRAAAVGDGLLDGDTVVGRAAITRVAKVPEIEELSAAVYSCGGGAEG